MKCCSIYKFSTTKNKERTDGFCFFIWSGCYHFFVCFLFQTPPTSILWVPFEENQWQVQDLFKVWWKGWAQETAVLFQKEFFPLLKSLWDWNMIAVLTSLFLSHPFIIFPLFPSYPFGFRPCFCDGLLKFWICLCIIHMYPFIDAYIYSYMIHTETGVRGYKYSCNVMKIDMNGSMFSCKCFFDWFGFSGRGMLNGSFCTCLVLCLIYDLVHV